MHCIPVRPPPPIMPARTCCLTLSPPLLPPPPPPLQELDCVEPSISYVKSPANFTSKYHSAPR